MLFRSENDLLNTTADNSETLPKNSAALESAIPTKDSALSNNNADTTGDKTQGAESVEDSTEDSTEDTSEPKDQGPGFMDVMPGIASSYIFTLKPGDKVTMSGPYGDFHPIFDSKKEMMWIGGGAGMAPLRAQIMHMTKTLHTTDRVMNYFYGARALNEVFYLEDFLQIEKDFPNFKFHLALDRPDPAADAAGVKYTPGFVHNVIYETYLKDHEAPEDIEYYMCGPGPMSKAVEKMLDDLGVPAQNLMFDNFGG